MITMLTLCTGNVCRSPLAAMMLTNRLDPTRFEVASAGIAPLIGDRMPDEALSIASRMDLDDATQHRAAEVTSDLIANSDLVIGMTRAHRSSAITLEPAAVKKAFTLLEFAHVVSHIQHEPMSTPEYQDTDVERATLETIKRMRGVVAPLHPDERYDVEDPYGRSKQVFQRSARQIDNAVEQIAEFFHHALASSQTRSNAVTPKGGTTDVAENTE